MKIKYSIPFAFLLLFSFVGCQDLSEDPRADLTPGTYFKTQADLNASVASMYEKLARDGAWGFTSRMTSYFGSDDLTTDPGLNKADMRDFDRLSGGAGNGSMASEWEGPWKTIYQANNVLANYQQVESTDDLKNNSAGQAYFMRGMCYYYLVRTFGKLPIVTSMIDVDLRPERAEVADVYKQIVLDLKAAEDLLPTTQAVGRPSKYSAKALLADVYLTMAGWPLNQTANYQLAADKAWEVIKDNVYTLVSDYATVFTTNNNTESVFSLGYNVAGNLPQRSFGSSCVPLEEESLNGSTGWDDYYSEINFFKNAPKCKRTDATFYTTFKLIQKPEGKPKYYDLVPWDSPRTRVQHPYYKKFRAGLVNDGVNETDTSIITMNPSTGKSLEIIRYPQVLLDYAEASAMAGNAPTTNGYMAINLVRKRAGLPDLTPGLSATAFRDSVVYERAYEFAGEFGFRWFDIVRLQLLPKIIAERATVNENSIPAAIVADPSKKYLAPIPDKEMVRNPTWTQNDDY